MKIVVNKCFGGYSISPKAALWLFERGFDEAGFKIPVDEYWGNDTYGDDHILSKKSALKKWHEYLQGKKDYFFLTYFSPDEKFVLNSRHEKRDHKLLVECIETLGSEASSGSSAELEVIEIPDNVDWEIHEYDGLESIHEKHRSW